METPRPRRRLFRLILAVGVPLALVGGLELALRIGGFDHELAPPPYRFMNPERDGAELNHPGLPTVTDDELFWRLRPGWVSADGRLEVGPDGFRTPRYALRKRPDVERVLCLGDSSVFGVSVDADEVWARRLETALRDARRTDDVEVLNMGVIGYTSHQGRLQLERHIDALTPDVVVVAFGAFNDWVPAVGRPDAEQGEVDWWTDVRILQLAVRLFGGSDDPMFDQTLEELVTRDYDGPRRVPLSDFEDNLRALGMTASSAGARVVLVVPPLPKDTVDNNPIATRYADAVRRIATEQGFALADAWRAFEATGATDDELFLDFAHPTARGHGVLADAVRAALDER